jgi:hypothetical protein
VVPQALLSSGAFVNSSGGQSTTDFSGSVGVSVLLPDASANAREVVPVVPVSSEFKIRNFQYVTAMKCSVHARCK